MVGEEQRFPRPRKEELERIRLETQEAIQKIVRVKIQASQPSTPIQEGDGTRFVRYTPSSQSLHHEEMPQQRIIRISAMPVDPLEPPKFKVRNQIRDPPPPSAPVMHSPPRKLTPEEQQSWKIPACISNWKNPKGYTISLENREVVDGRNLKDVVVSDKFAKVTDSLYIAERIAREEIEKRAALQNKVVSEQKAERDLKLREAAIQARMERSQIQYSDNRNEQVNTMIPVKRKREDDESVYTNTNSQDLEQQNI
ncbi:MAG: putative SNW/SKI-interacting protein A, partial [Streblomastix strix]